MKKDISKELGKEIRDKLERWESLQVRGGSDPFWEDGCNMNLLRGHVIYAKKRCVEELDPSNFPPEYYLDTPPQVDNTYMARAGEITRNARNSLKVYMDNPDYQYLKKAKIRLSEREKSDTCISTATGYVRGLAEAIREGDTLYMRRHERTDWYINSFRQCRAKVEAILSVRCGEEQPLPEGQLSLFDVFEIEEGK